jgi:hypothetical protein
MEQDCVGNGTTFSGLPRLVRSDARASARSRLLWWRACFLITRSRLSAVQHLSVTVPHNYVGMAETVLAGTRSPYLSLLVFLLNALLGCQSAFILSDCRR